MYNYKNNNYIAANAHSAINTHGELLYIGDLVSHEGADDTARITSFYIDTVYGEVRAHTNKGTAGIDFLTKIQQEDEILPEEPDNSRSSSI